MTDEVRQEEWECFSDASYYDLWCVRRVGEREFGQGFHLVNGKEAEALRAFLAAQTSPLRTRIAELEGALGEIVARAPYPEHGDGEACHRCCHCGYRWPDRFEERHANHCAYVIARATLNGEKKHG